MVEKRWTCEIISTHKIWKILGIKSMRVIIFERDFDGCYLENFSEIKMLENLRKAEEANFKKSIFVFMENLKFQAEIISF